MEGIIEFIKTYWGFTIFGSVTIGTVITFIAVSLKMLVRAKLRNKLIDNLSTRVKELSDSNEAKSVEITNTLNAYTHLMKIVNVNFKAITYLIMASKLPIDEKEKLLNEIGNLDISPDTPNVPEVLEEVQEKSKTILEKYRA